MPGYSIIIRMKTLHLIMQMAAPTLVLLYCLPSLAATVYRTVDDKGVVSFTDIKPNSDNVVDTLIIDAQAPQLSEIEQQRLTEMRETTDRMASDRMARKKHRAEIRKLQSETQPQYQSPYEYQQNYNPGFIGYTSGYSSSRYTNPYNYPRRNSWRRKHNSRPEHPIAGHPGPGRPGADYPGTRPPLRLPAQSSSAAIRTTLPGNNYPASLIRKSYDPKVRAAIGN